MHRAVQLNNARTKDNSSNNATLSSLLNGVSLHNTEVRLPCKGVKKVKYDSSNKLPVWVSNNLRNDSTASKHYSTSSFVYQRKKNISASKPQGNPRLVRKTCSKKTQTRSDLHSHNTCQSFDSCDIQPIVLGDQQNTGGHSPPLTNLLRCNVYVI